MGSATADLNPLNPHSSSFHSLERPNHVHPNPENREEDEDDEARSKKLVAEMMEKLNVLLSKITYKLHHKNIKSFKKKKKKKG